MKKIFCTCFFLLLFIIVVHNISNAQSVVYYSPKPGSDLNSEESNIIIGMSGTITNPVNLRVTGSISGLHSGRIQTVGNKSKLIFKPNNNFIFGETVTVSGYSGTDSYSFQIRKNKPVLYSGILNELNLSYSKTIKKSYPYTLKSNTDGGYTDSLPDLNITINGPTAPGSIFISNFSNNPLAESYLMILNNDGSPVFDKMLYARGFDFKKQNPNLITYYDAVHQKFLGLNNSFAVIDSFYCGNGYSTDIHELRVMPDGSAWMMSYDPEFVDMSKIVPGGQPNALVTGLIVQQIDANKNVIFQWRSWDHYKITDATHEDLLALNIDYVHGNAIEIDNEGNIMISCRHLDEITKINPVTGDIVWRLGGKNNQFTFINDPAGFSHQHYVRRTQAGSLILFDNGNFHTPHYSRAVEYNLDEHNYLVFEIWEYRHTPDIYAAAMGSVQRLENGNTLIGWGSASTTLSEVTPNNELVYELSLPPGEFSYRAFRFEWEILTGVHNTTGIPAQYFLSQNYPNPFNPVTKIRYIIPANVNGASDIKLTVFDLTGRRIATLAEGYQTPGLHEITFDGSSMSSGVYFYRLTAGDFSMTRKMLLIK